MTRTLHNPVTGQSIEIRGVEGDVLEMESTWRGRGERPPLHYHPVQRESFDVLEGELRVVIGDDERVYRAGESFEVAPGVKHEMSGAIDGETRALWRIQPAMRTAEMIESVWLLAEDGKVDKKGMPSPLWLLSIAHRHRDELRLAGLPWPLQRAVLAIGAGVARLFGIRGRYEGASPSRSAGRRAEPQGGS
jgi:quercetin dioxygenase-like cupin family protein